MIKSSQLTEITLQLPAAHMLNRSDRVHRCSIGVDLTQKVGGRVNATMPCRINFTANWIRMVHPSGNGNGGYTACPPASWYDDALDIRPGWYRADPTLPEPCWAGVDNWMNGQVCERRPSPSAPVLVVNQAASLIRATLARTLFSPRVSRCAQNAADAGQPKTTPGWPGWIHGVPWGPRPSPDPWAKGQRENMTCSFGFLWVCNSEPDKTCCPLCCQGRWMWHYRQLPGP
jgi:hypothetical protein